MDSLGAAAEVAKKAMWLYPKPMGFIPSERWGHTACYSHGLVYIFGGCCGGMQFSDVLVLNLNAMAWSTLMTKGNSPGPRDSHSTVLWRNNMVVFGGANGTKKVNDLHILDLGTNEWIKPVCIGTPPSPRESHSATLISDEKMVVFGGSGEGTGNYLNDLHILDLRTMTWTSPEVKGNVPSPRDSHAAVAVGGRLFVLGGDCGDRYHGESDVFDIDSLTWTRLGVLATSPGARAGHAAVSIGGKIYVIGGVGDKRYYNDAWVLDTNTCGWSKVEIYGHQPQGRFSHTAIVTESDIAIYGGCGADERPLKELLILHLGAEQPSVLGSATLHPKRRRMANSGTWDLGSEPEEHSVSLSQQSSPSQSDHEQASSRRTPASPAVALWNQGNYSSAQLAKAKAVDAASNVPSASWSAEQGFVISPLNNMDQRSSKKNTGHLVHAIDHGRQSGEGRPKAIGWAHNLVGAEVQGKVDGLFDSGYLMTATVDGRTFRGVLFAPGLGLVHRGAAASQSSSCMSNKIPCCCGGPMVPETRGSNGRQKAARRLPPDGQVTLVDRESRLLGAGAGAGGDLRDIVLTLGAPGSGH